MWLVEIIYTWIKKIIIKLNQNLDLKKMKIHRF
jgi:hypothetical protein